MSYPSVYAPAGGFNLRVPMPIPRTQNAPFFNGRYLEDFLKLIIQHGANAGITDANKLVRYIIDYSSDKVKDNIIYLDEFDLDKTPKPTWNLAKEALTLLYSATDKPKDYTEEELKAFCREKAAKQSFSKVSDVENYLRDFIAIAASLKKRKILSTEEYNLYFVQGLPTSLKDWFASAIPETQHWKKEESSEAKHLFDEFGNRIDITKYYTELSSEIQATTVPGLTPAPVSVKPKLTSVDELAKQLEALTLTINSLRNSGSNATVDPKTMSRDQLAGEVERLKGLMDNGSVKPQQGSDFVNNRRYFICGKVGTHPIGPRNCPETNSLLTEHLMTFDAQRNRYILPSGQDLPRVPPGWSGGVASYLRYQSSNAKSSVSNSLIVILLLICVVVIHGHSFALESIGPEANYSSYPSLRSGKDTNNHFNPLDRPADKTKNPKTNSHKPIPNPTPSPNPTTNPPPKAPQQPQQSQQPQVPPPSHPINTEQGWKASRPGNPRGGVPQDVQMKDGEKKNIGPQYHFTSKVQESADPQSIYSSIGETNVPITLAQLLAISPPLAKIFAENTRTRREYGPAKEGFTAKQL
ncbi:hypothetical protein GYMLUDRAFT_250070 [Collybiopsis luxurians FD-317 M1]|uniref:DUF4100 domain-containing protein n=1 Tax=Collybiopsis luxurians FD-317 M1 TaxID=944289 RepID=A0A0D0ATE2_9AGAR|nr:hypothetical protein GYMLUDRAFT_250070 [Collybiopsis luxurians FD-317 M1]